MTTQRCTWHLTIIGVIAAAFLCAVSAEATMYHVSISGDDDHAGTEAQPLRTIQRAADRARAGDAIVLHAGVYAQTVVLRFSGEEGKPITLTSRQGERAVIQPVEKGQRPPGQTVLLQAEAGYQHAIGWITIDGLEMRHGHDGLKMYNAHDIVVRNCHIHDSWNQGILGNGNRVLIERNIIAGSGQDPKSNPSLKHGIYATGTAFTIINNFIHSNSAYGIQVAAYDYKPKEMAGPEYAEAKDWLIANNTLAFNKVSSGIVLWQDGVENCVVRNNIFYKNGGPNGIVFYTQKGRRHVVQNNLFFPTGENLAATEPDAYEASDNLQADPQFAGPESFDFHLKPGSPAIDVGADLTGRGIRTDFDGDARPHGKGFDVGADEFKETAVAFRKAAIGPLRVHPTNPRYFTDGTKTPDGSLKAVYLTGSHTWGNLADGHDHPAFDYTAYLDFLDEYQHNFIRLWSGYNLGRAPIPYERSGPGAALDGKPRVDLARLDPLFFERLRSRVIAARDRGIYVAIMLFAVDGSKKEDWPILLFNRGNNVQEVDADLNRDGSGAEADDLSIPGITDYQEAFVRKVIDSVNDLDNVLYEIGNEGDLTSVPWQYHFIRFIKKYEAGKPRQHPVGMTAVFNILGGSWTTDNRALFESPADWISPGSDPYKDNPPAADGKKVIIADVDHIWPSAPHRGWIWECFLRGLQPILMDWYRYGEPKWTSSAEQEAMRKSMGYTLTYARGMKLAALVPRNELASTAYCLADPGAEYLIYQPESGEAFSVELKAGTYRYEWFDPAKGTGADSGNIEATDGTRQFKAPFDGEALLHLKAE